ncbi:MAG: carbohydrate kinase [Clostridia bacterium]|nr:carbohydrate kinase [Clostridia bacterium]
MTESRLGELLSRFPSLRITVVGDLFLDRWWEIDRDLDEESVETSLTAYQITGRRVSAGAAGTVLNNLSDLGVGTLRCVSLLGDDGEGWEVSRLLAAKRVDASLVVKSPDLFTPFYNKPMFRHGGGKETEGERFDLRNRRPTPKDVEERLIQNLSAAAEDSDAVIVLDQLTDENTGVVTARMRAALARLGEEKPGLLIFADSRAFAHLFTGVVIKCNDLEAQRLVLGREGETFDLGVLSRCLSALRERSGRPAAVTCGPRGVLVEEDGSPRLLPALPVTGDIDVCGCGDACTSGMVSALCAGASWAEAAEVGNLCSAVTIRKLGTTGTASPAELLARLREAAPT